MACNIIKGSDGTNTVVDANGNPSILYDNLIQLLNEYPYVTSELIPTDDINNLALQYYELSNTPEFRSKYNLTSKLDVEVSIDDIINHINTEYSFNETQEVKEGIYPYDRIVFGHPTIGKSFLKNQGEDKFISLDDDYSEEINNEVKEIANKYNVTTYEVKDGGIQEWNNEYNQMMQELFDIAKQQAISENKTLFTSNTNLLKNNTESFDKVINLIDKEFERRIQERGAKYDTKEWKSQINKVISKLPKNKVINTDKYLSDLFIIPEVETNINYQLASDVINPAIEELDNYLLDFLKNFNVKSKQFEELKSKLGVDALGATDSLNKLIWYVKNRNEETLPEESAHMLVALMGENHPDINELLNNITNWSEYNDIKNQYLPIYKDENKVKIEAVGKLIAKALVKNYKVNGLDKNKLQKALDRILKYIKEILDSISFNNVFMYNDSVADHIAINVLSGNKDYIYKITNLNPNLNAKEEINNNPHAKNIINKFSSNNVKMTGSLAIAGTENIRRPKGKGIHDIDFKVKSFELFEKEVLPKISNNAVPAHYGWHKKEYSTFAYLIPLEGYRIEILERKDDFSNGLITEYKLYNEKNKEVEITQSNVIALDFFVYKEGYYQKDFNFSSDFIPASLVYEGKMSLGGKSNPYFFSRDKDQEDYVLRNPKSFIPFEKYVYYQLPNQSKSTIESSFGLNTKIDIPVVDKLSNEDKRNELDILLNAINKLKRDKVYSEKTINTITRMMRDIGFNMGSFEEIVAKSKRPYLKKENAIVDITAKMIHISEGGSVSDLLEEIGHIISAQLDGADFEQALELIKNDPKYTNEMQKYIAIYQSEEQYTGEDAIDKAATEVLGHLIGEQLGNKLEETTDETLVGLIKRFIKRVLGMFRNQFDLHKYVSQSVDYFIQTPNRPFKRETYYYSLNVNKKNYERLLYNLKQQLNKLTDLKSKYDENKTEPKLFKSSSNYNRLANLKKQISSIANEWMDVKTDKNLLDFLDSMLYDTNEVVDWIKKYIDVADSDVVITLSDGTEETLKTYITLGFKDDFNISDVSLSALSQARDYVNNYNSVILILNNIIDNNTRLSQEVKIDLKKYVGNLRDRLAFIENSVKEINEKKTQEVIKKLVEETGVTYDYDSLPDTVKNAMESYESTTDLNTAEVWFGPMGMVNSSISRLVDGTFNLLYNNARIKTIDFSNSFLDKFKSYIGRNMSFVAEKYNGKTTGDFIDEYYWGQWNIERVKFMKELNTSKEFNFPIDAYLRGEEFDDIKLFNKERKELDDRLEKLNDDLLGTMPNSQEYNELKEIIDNLSIKIEVFEEKADMLDNYLNKINNWYKSNAKQRHNVDDIINHYKTILSDDDFNIWYDRNVVTNSKNKVLFYKGELSQPSDKWKNKDFNKLTNEQKRILSELKAYKKEFDDMIGLPVNNMMPQMYQSMLNSLYDDKLSNIAKNVKGQLQRAFTRTSDDTQFEPDQEMRHFQEDNRIVSYIGSRYTKRLNNPEYISTDILGSMIGYAQMAYEFKEKMQRIDQFELIAQKMKKTKYANTSNKLTSNSLEKLTNHLEVHMMGKEEKVREINIPGTNLNINVNKVVAKFNKWISHSNLALGFVTQTANIITSNINGVLETILGQHVTTKSSGFAMKEFTRLFTSETMKEFGKTIKTNKLDLMLRYFGLSENADTMFNDLNKHIMMRKPLSTVAYAGYELGSYYINGIALLSILNNNRFYDGKLYTEQAFKDLQNNVSFDSLPSAYDSIVIKNGKLELVGLKASELNLLINKVRDLSKKLDGKLTKEDYAMAHTNIIGMSALMHRNWMIDGAFRRMKAKGLNFKTGEVDEGYWVTTKDLIGKFLYSKEKLKVLANLRANYKNLSRSQQLGLNRTLLDLASIGAMVAVAALIFNGGDDDDDESSQFLAYLSNRVLLEVSSFYNPFEILYAVTDPIVSARQMETLMHLGNAIKFEEIERGKWEGYTRAEKYWYSLIPGVKGVMQTQDTESSNQFLKNKQLSWLY